MSSTNQNKCLPPSSMPRLRTKMLTMYTWASVYRRMATYSPTKMPQLVGMSIRCLLPYTILDYIDDSSTSNFKRKQMKTHGDVNAQSLFNSFRHGFRSLSHNAHWVTSPGFQISIASSILSVAGLIIAFRDGRGRRGFNNLLLSWSSSSENESSPEKLWAVPGLQNLGNNCFLNVVLQALASCSSFLSSLQNIVEEVEASSEIEQIGDMPLAVSLNSLLQELCIIRHEGKVLSPRKVMLAMALYTPNFNLTSQQDAEEALAHMLSSLREECSTCFGSNQNSLALATGSSSRILVPNKRVIYSELERWTQSFLGPFNGIVGSILTCQSCSFQVE
ncbi:hypothetical protein LXL04_014152 [Taraxacum kok-saghyz]